jgi:hypothetical protein
MRHLRVALLAAGALLSTSCDRSSSSVTVTAETAASTAAKAPSSASVAPPRDDTPPAWLPPPDYVEIPWVKAAQLIRTRVADRVIGTKTRRVYLSTPSGEKFFTTEPKHRDNKLLVDYVMESKGLVMYREYEEISWKEAEDHIRNKRAKNIGLAHFQVATLSLPDGRHVFFIPPKDVNLAALVEQIDPSIGVTVE